MTELALLSAFVEEHALNYKFPKEPVNLYDPLRYFLTLGGKRMRPILTLMSGQLFGISKEESISAALTIELFHNFSLIHDDIMDEAPVRRGKTTVHEKWNTNIAILSGDVLFVEAYQQLTVYRDERLALLLERFNQTAIEVCQGQQLDMDFEQLKEVSASEYIEMIRLKTSVLLGCALEFGAILGRQDLKTRKAVYDFGVELGIAFQIQDDILDLYADPEKFGKQVGGDILSNKKTLLLLTAQQIAQANGDKRVIELLAMAPSQDKIEFARRLFNELKATEKVSEIMNGYYDAAMRSLHTLDLSTETLAPIESLAHFLMNREN